ncbi:sensor histidine kinase [Roseibium aggregatum]|uniref:sensor histidine kinase n=1 Tax=Roseibium aggregatum TaxID=187304 RepID=UPI00094A9CAC|nr:sensor histidine kinase [Roseibium aggregatum]UFI02881.1 sensor histidine kinase [Roseibium aggregatum]
MTRILHLWALLFFSLLVTGIARAETVRLEPGQGIGDLKPHLVYESDPSASLADILNRFRSGKFSPTLKASLLETNYAPEAWAAVEIVNATLNDGRAPDPFVLTIDLPLVSELDAYVIRESGFTESLISYSIFEPFAPEDHSVTRLRTPVFDIAPQERVTLLVNFKFGPFQSFKMALETPVELEASAFASGITHTAFYAFTISCLIFFFGFHLAMKNWIGMLYAVQFGLGLAFIAYIDGLWFRFFFPDRPELQSPTGFFLLFSLSGLGFVISGRSVATTGRETRLSIGLTALSALSIAGFGLSFFSPGTYVAFFGYVLLALMFVSVFLAGRSWRRSEGAAHVSSELVSAFGTVLVVGLIALMVVGLETEILPVASTVKGIFSCLLIATMTGLTAHIVALRHKHANAVQAEIAALEAEAKRSRELLVAERNYTRARDLASLRQRQLATASHDLKQPITSLRLSFDHLADHMEPPVRQRLAEAFDYMEALSNSYLAETAPRNDGAETAESSDPTGEEDQTQKDIAITRAEPAETESYELSLVLDTVQQMFGEEAISKGLKLRRVTSTRKTAMPPMVLMRIASNLVSNAVKYTEKGKVLIGVRNRGQSLELCVLDTGPGLTETEQRTFLKAYEKGSTSSGHGLGLSVCHDLAREHGLAFTCQSVKSRGTQFRLSLPASS